MIVKVFNLQTILVTIIEFISYLVLIALSMLMSLTTDFSYSNLGLILIIDLIGFLLIDGFFSWFKSYREISIELYPKEVLT